MSFWLPLAMAGAGMAKGVMDQGQVREQQKLEAVKARYSPWTGIAPQNIPNADPLGSAMQGGMAGMSLGQNMDAADQANVFQQKQLELQQAQLDQNEGLNAAKINYYNRMGGVPPRAQ